MVVGKNFGRGYAHVPWGLSIYRKSADTNGSSTKMLHTQVGHPETQELDKHHRSAPDYVGCFLRGNEKGSICIFLTVQFLLVLEGGNCTVIQAASLC